MRFGPPPACRVAWRRGVVAGTTRSWAGALELQVRVGSDLVAALAFPELVGLPQVGDQVLLNVNALELALGTGGYALVVALPDRLPTDVLPTDALPTDALPTDALPTGALSSGALMKARYTPLQAVATAPDTPVQDRLPPPGLPVVVADLHSALPAVLAGVLDRRPTTRVAYVMTDGASLPLWLSSTVAGLAGWLAGTVTVGQAFGGDVEEVTVHAGLLAAVSSLGAEVALVCQGPGNVGTGTTWGFSGVAAGEAINAAAAVGGRPVGVLRMSTADPRVRHQGVSHHSLTAYGRVALAPADLPVPSSYAHLALPALAGMTSRHQVVVVDDGGLLEALRRSPVPLSTMGRGLAEDPVAFLAGAAAGRHAAALLD